jgi:hypothetical protein
MGVIFEKKKFRGATRSKGKKAKEQRATKSWQLHSQLENQNS